MRELRNSPLALVALSAVTGLVAAALLLDWLVVDVRAAGGPRVWVPVPMAAVRAAAALLPDAAIPPEELPPEAAAGLRAAARSVRELAAAPPGTRISVTSPEGSVLVTVEDGVLVTAVEAPEATVHVRVPLRRLARALERWDGERLDARALRALLAALDDGFEVRVQDREAKVRVAVR